MYRKRKHSITVGTMTGVIQKTADRDVLEGIVTSYFTDSLQSFVNDFLQLTKDQVYMVEDKIMKQLAVSLFCSYICPLNYMHHAEVINIMPIDLPGIVVQAAMPMKILN